MAIFVGQFHVTFYCMLLSRNKIQCTYDACYVFFTGINLNLLLRIFVYCFYRKCLTFKCVAKPRMSVMETLKCCYGQIDLQSLVCLLA